MSASLMSESPVSANPASDAAISLPLTGPQLGMWSAQQLDPDSPALWTAEAVELEGPLDEAALEAAIREALQACDALHMRYEGEGADVVQRLRESRSVVIGREDYADCERPWDSAWRWMREDLLRPADLARRPLFATALIRLSAQRHLWYLRAHHIALDGFAYLLLIHRVAELYSARTGGRAAAAARDWSLAPLVAEEADYRASPQFALSREFWLQRCEDRAEPVTLGPKCAPDDSARSSRLQLPAGEHQRWHHAARALGVDWSAWLIAAVFAWMRARSGSDAISLGLLAMNRLGSAALGVPCMGMNVVPLRLRLQPQWSFAELARAVAAELRELRPHQRYNYEWLRQDLGLGDSHAQLYGPVLNLMPFDRGFVFDGLRSRAHPVSVGSVEDLDLTVSPLADGVRFDIEANPLAYDAATLDAHHRALVATMRAALADSSLRLDQLHGALAREAA
ncbi:condensation domain-containing protein [Lysobacter enzymogenes]|nr:condensation domain-containing protein [Lysobacter enzymogenes]